MIVNVRFKNALIGIAAMKSIDLWFSKDQLVAFVIMNRLKRSKT